MLQRILTLVLISHLVFLTHLARGDQTPDDRLVRPKIAVVLGGGGAHGVTHLGVLQELERQRVPIDLVVGSGFGGIVGGLYASGMSLGEIHTFLVETNWPNVFDPDSQREDLSFRRKTDDADYLIKYKVGIKDGQALLPTSLVPNEKLARLLQTVTADIKGVKNFDALPIAFRAVAMNLVTGDQVVLANGALDRAILATSSSPGTLPPVEIDKQLLVTGSLVNNLPIDVARQWGADVIIVVDIGSYVRSAADLNSIFTVVDQVSHLLLQKNSEASIRRLGERDILIQPNIVPDKETNFDNLSENIEKGVTAVADLGDAFAGVRLNDKQYAELSARRAVQRSRKPVINGIELLNESNVNNEVILSLVTQALDRPLDKAALEKDLLKIYGIGAFSSVDFDLVDQGESSLLQLSVVENRAGNRFWRFGLSLEDDLDGNSAYTGSASMTWTQLNRLDAEWRSQVRIGERQQISTEFYQPLVKTGRYFISTSAGYTERNVNSYFDGDIVAQSRVKERVGQVQLGRIFGNSGQITIGVLAGSGTTSVNIGGDIPSVEFDIGGYTATAAYDTYDNIYFPKTGSRATLGWVGQRESAGSSLDVDIAIGHVATAMSWGAHTFIAGLDIQTQLNKVAGSQNLVTVGGLFQLSGFQRDELSGRHTAVGRAIYYRRLRSNPLRGFLDASLYVGASLELGNAWQDSDEISFSNTLTAGALFVGADTFIGPVYLAAGLAEGGNFATYLFVGRPF